MSHILIRNTSRLYRYSLFGLCIHSCLELPELPEELLQPGVEPDVVIQVGAVPNDLPEPEHRIFVSATDRFETKDGNLLLHMEATARYLITGGWQITIDPAPSASEINIRLYLLGTCFAAVCHQRGILPIHASMLLSKAGKEAIAFAGRSGAGKSTLAAYFHDRGYSVLADDLCAVDPEEDGLPRAWPGVPRVKLWEDALIATGRDPRQHQLAIAGAPKYHMPLPSERASEPAVLRAIYSIARSEDHAEFSIVRLRGAEAASEIIRNTYRPNLIQPLNAGEAHFRRCLLLAQKIAVYRVHRSWGFDRFQQQAQLLEDHMSQTVQREDHS